MTVLAPFKAHVDYDDAESRQPYAANPGLARSLINNVLHKADQMGQTRCAWIGRTASDYRERSFAAVDTYQRIMPPLPMVWARRPKLELMRARVRLAGSVSAAAGTGTFRVYIGARPFESTQLNAGAGEADVLQFTTTSSTMAWLGEGVLTLDYPRILSRGQQTWTVKGTSEDVQTILAVPYLFVWGAVSNVSDSLRIGGLHVQEWVGL